MHGSSSGSETFRLEFDEPTPEIDLASPRPLGLRGTLCRESHRPAQPAGTTGTGLPVSDRHRPSVRQARQALIEKAVRWLEVELSIGRPALLRHLTGTLDGDAEMDEPAPHKFGKAPAEADLLAEAQALARRKGLTRAELAARQAHARQLLRENPALAGAEVSKLAKVGRQLISRLAREMFPEGRPIKHVDGRVCVRGGKPYRRAGA